jgi:hypothetical protein
VYLNGAALALGRNDELPGLSAIAQPAGTATFAPETITFLSFNETGNTAAEWVRGSAANRLVKN